MHNLYLSLLICLFASTIQGQIIWSKKYDFQGSTTSRALIETQNGELLIGGYTFSTQSSGSRNLFMLKINGSTGDSLKLEKCPSGPSCNDRSWIEHLFESPKGELLSFNETYYPPCAYLSKHTTGIDIEWGSPLCIDTIHYVNAVQTFADGFVFAGQFSLNDFILQKRDYSGKKIWSRRIKVREIGMQPQLVALPDGKVAILYRDGLNSGQTYLECFDKDGKSLWRNLTGGIFHLASNPKAPFIYTIEGVRSNFNSFLVKKLSALNGQTLWESSREDRNFSPTSLGIDTSGQIFVGGNLYIPDFSPAKAFLALTKFDANGKFLWRNYYEQPGFIGFQKMLLTKKEDLVFLLWGETPNGFKLVKMNKEGLSTSLDNPQEELNIQTFPNPVKDAFFIRSQQLVDRALNYQILATDGKRLSQGLVSNDLQKVDVSNFPKGIYFLIFTDENGQSSAQKIIKH